jgi:tRNA-splicing ligase RtcB
MKMVENHHNFAWKEKHEGKEVLCIRKGSNTCRQRCIGNYSRLNVCTGFIVKGKGEAASLSSASHGAGRKMSRTGSLEKLLRIKSCNESMQNTA